MLILQLFKALFAIGISLVLLLSLILFVAFLWSEGNKHDDVDE